MIQGRFIYDGSEAVAHRVWFKVLLNPVLRRLGYQIVTKYTTVQTYSGHPRLKVKSYELRDYVPPDATFRGVK